ncbi:energy transducer TonB [Flammeovirga aprica]|uniref:Energy transducer TonB n=1 Tax=Flammeovirga aprica JL-4 TaxID=694437 RepID=A0A7X9RVA8_9BACT|nr:energy transducer TonB [Flammeovirga aprica]NME69352.1 energy transducer TonB [Flammeovirga aprica JL-4]
MIDILKFMGPEGLFISFLVVLIGIVQLFRVIISKQNNLSPLSKSNPLVKKYDDVNLDKYTNFFRMLGLSIGLTIILAAFEYPTPESVLITLDDTSFFIDDEVDSAFVLPEPKIPQPKKVPKVVIIPVDDSEEETLDIEIEIPEDFDSETVIETYEPDAEEEEEKVENEVHVIVEKTASFKGGMGKFYKWLGKKIKYPSQAKRMGVSGKVFVEFIIERDGSLSNLKVVRGIGAGCDEEAVRVLKACPKWSPGEQRGRPVRQKMVLPISFRLQN